MEESCVTDYHEVKDAIEGDDRGFIFKDFLWKLLEQLWIKLYHKVSPGN